MTNLELRLKRIDEKYDALDGRFRDLEHKQYEFERDTAVFKNTVEEYIKNNDKRMNEYREDMQAIKEDSKQTRRMIWANIGAWVIGVIAILVALSSK